MDYVGTIAFVAAIALSILFVSTVIGLIIKKDEKAEFEKSAKEEIDNLTKIIQRLQDRRRNVSEDRDRRELR